MESISFILLIPFFTLCRLLNFPLFSSQFLLSSLLKLRSLIFSLFDSVLYCQGPLGHYPKYLVPSPSPSGNSSYPPFVTVPLPTGPFGVTTSLQTPPTTIQSKYPHFTRMFFKGRESPNSSKFLTYASTLTTVFDGGINFIPPRVVRFFTGKY